MNVFAERILPHEPQPEEATTFWSPWLHQAIMSGDFRFVIYVLSQQHSTLSERNSHGETPAYIAAREGHMDILALMIKHFRNHPADIVQLLTNDDGHNALHIAIQNRHVGVVCLLIKEVPQLANVSNNFGESPLYLAAERGCSTITELIMDKCENISFDGPNRKTALHAAAISGSGVCIRHLLANGRYNNRLNVIDGAVKKAWDYAFSGNNSDAVASILSADLSFADQITPEDGRTPIQNAAILDYVETMKILISKRPGCFEVTDNRQKNILHLAIENRSIEVIKFILQDDSLTSLVNQKDEDGNTPIHLFMASDLEMDGIIFDHRVNINVLNNIQHTPLGMTQSEERRKRLLKSIVMDTSEHNETNVVTPEIKESNQNGEEIGKAFTIAEKILVVVALIATITYAATFTVPGGFHTEGDKAGTPILVTKPVFVAFVFSNMLAFCCSCSVLFGYLVLVFFRNKYPKDDPEAEDEMQARASTMYFITGLALLAMVVAFATGLHVILPELLGNEMLYLSMALFFTGGVLVYCK